MADLKVYFPINNLNPQGWISQFITPVLQKTGINRSNMSNLFYDNVLSSKTRDELKKIFKDEQKEKKYFENRAVLDDQKLIYLNGNYLDVLEIDGNLNDSTLYDNELIAYTTFMSQIKPHQQAFLQPYMYMEYGYRKNANEDYSWVTFPFTQKFDIDYILGPGKPKSEGAGIESVNTENQFNIATHINSAIAIKFFFGNLQILTREINKNGIPTQKELNTEFPYGFSFAKLVSNLDLTKEAIRLVYGRKVATGFEEVVGNQELKSIIERREKKTYLLCKTKHTFSFNEQGQINLTVNYNNFHDERMGLSNNIAVPYEKSRVMQTVRTPKNFGNYLKTYRQLLGKVKELEQKIQTAQSSYDVGTMNKTKEEERKVLMSELNKELVKTNRNLNLLKKSIKPSLTTVFLDQIKAQGQLFGVNFNTQKSGEKFTIKTNIFLVQDIPEDKTSKNGDFIDIFKFETTYDINKLVKDPKIKSDQSLKNKLTRVYARIFNSPYDDQAKNDKKYGNMMFFPLKALFLAAYSFLDDEEKKEVPYMLFGNTLLKVNGQICSINIGDLLVETNTFQTWYYKNFFNKDRLDYPYGVFIRDVMRDLVPEILYRNRVGFDDKAPTSAVKEVKYYLKADINPLLKQQIYVDYNFDHLKQFAALLSKNPTANPKPLIYFGQITNQTNQITSPIFSNLGPSEFNFNELQDAQKGIPHIKIGSDGGFFTKINFNGSDFNKIRTALALESLAGNASRYFFFYYQLDINMLGCNMFNFDSVVCIPSGPLGMDAEENDIGITGYYKVKSFSDFIDKNNMYTTTAKADWVYNPRFSDRDKSKISLAPVNEIFVRDYLELSVNDPSSYVEDVILNDPNTVINAQAQTLPKEAAKDKEAAKKDSDPTTPGESPTQLDKDEDMGKTPLPTKEKK